MPVPDKELLIKAIDFAVEKHAGQRRRDGSLFVYHPLKVAELVMKCGNGYDYQIAAVLHDTLEGTDATEEEIEKLFGKEILECVKLLTREKGTDETKYVSAILRNHMASVVKNADMISNLWDAAYNENYGITRDKADLDWANRYLEKAKMYYEGKFSEALDKSISVLENELSCFYYPERKFPNFANEEMELYSDKEQREYENSKALYDPTSWPDTNDKKAVFACDDDNLIYFVTGDLRPKTFLLTRYGWKRIESEASDNCYAWDILYLTREQLRKEIDRLIETDYFFDFVETDKLI